MFLNLDHLFSFHFCYSQLSNHVNTVWRSSGKWIIKSPRDWRWYFCGILFSHGNILYFHPPLLRSRGIVTVEFMSALSDPDLHAMYAGGDVGVAIDGPHAIWTLEATVQRVVNNYFYHRISNFISLWPRRPISGRRRKDWGFWLLHCAAHCHHIYDDPVFNSICPVHDVYAFQQSHHGKHTAPSTFKMICMYIYSHPLCTLVWHSNLTLSLYVFTPCFLSNRVKKWILHRCGNNTLTCYSIPHSTISWICHTTAWSVAYHHIYQQPCIDLLVTTWCVLALF